MELSKLDMDPFDLRCIRWTNALENIAAGIVERREGIADNSLNITVRCSLLIPDDSYSTLTLSADKINYVMEMGVKRWTEWVLSSGAFMQVIADKLETSQTMGSGKIGYNIRSLLTDGYNFGFYLKNHPVMSVSASINNRTNFF
jgi:hypothetical protein